MAPLILLGAGPGPAAESPAVLPGDAQATLDDLAGLVFAPLEAQPQPHPLPLPEWEEPVPQEESAPVSEEAAVDPQQWLMAMLDQQAVQVQARSYGETRPQLPAPTDERLLSRLPTQAGVPGWESVGPTGRRLPADQAWPGVQAAQEALAQPVQRQAAALLSVLPQASPAGAAGVTASESLPLANPVTAQGAPLPGTLLAQEPVLERDLKLAAPQARWGEQMLHALRETVQVQVQQRFHQAAIRLDPPELGSLEILITQEPGRLSVQISAAQGDVARLLQHTSERLRQELVEHNALQVEVQVSSDSQGHAGRDASRQRQEPGVAESVQDAQDARPSNKHRTSDVLVTV